MREKNQVDAHIEEIQRLQRRMEAIPRQIDRIEEQLYSGNLNIREFNEKVSERAALYREKEVVARNLKRLLHNE